MFLQVWLVHWLRWNMNCALSALTSRKSCDCCDWLSIPFFLLSLPLSLSTFPLHCSSLQAHIFILCFFVLCSFLASEWEHPRADTHTLLCPCEIWKHPSLAKLRLLPEEAADKNSSFWRMVLGAAGSSHWNSFIYWKQDSGGWDLIKATENKSKSQVWTNCTQRTTCPPWGCLEYIVTRSLRLTSGSCFITALVYHS